MPRIFCCTRTSIRWKRNLPHCYKSPSRISYSDISTCISPRLSHWQMWSADMHCAIQYNESHDICWRDSGAPESGWIFLFHLKYIRGFRLMVHLKFATDEWLKLFAVIFSQFDSCHWSCNRSAPGTYNVANQFTPSHTIINNKHECQWSPTLAISDSRYNNSNIRTLIHFNIEYKQDLSIQYSVPYKQHFWLFVSVKKIM